MREARKIRCPRKLKKELKKWLQFDYINGVSTCDTVYDTQKRRGFFFWPAQ